MIIYPGIRLEAILALNVSTNQPHGHVDYIDYGQTGTQAYPNSTTFALNNSTLVIALPAPMGGQTKAREITELTIYNADTGNVSVAVRTSDGSTNRLYVSTTLNSTKSLIYTTDAAGWQII